MNCTLVKAPDLDKVVTTVMNLRCKKAAVEDAIPGELLTTGITALAVSHFHLVSSCLSFGALPQEFKDAKITTTYKQ